MNDKHTRSEFALSPLITPERIRNNPRRCLATLPAWAREAVYLDGRVFLVAGGICELAVHMPLLEFAILCELTRYGHTIVTNRREAVPGAIVYLKVAYSNAANENKQVRRLFSGAAEGEAVKPAGIASDYSADNVYFVPDSRAKKDERAVAMGHAAWAAAAYGASAELIGPYIANLAGLFNTLDRRIAGEQLAQ